MLLYAALYVLDAAIYDSAETCKVLVVTGS
jgi:hypothetical protein